MLALSLERQAPGFVGQFVLEVAADPLADSLVLELEQQRQAPGLEPDLAAADPLADALAAVVAAWRLAGHDLAGRFAQQLANGNLSLVPPSRSFLPLPQPPPA